MSGDCQSCTRFPVYQLMLHLHCCLLHQRCSSIATFEPCILTSSALLTLSSMIAAAVQLIPSFYHHASTAYMRRKKDIIQQTATAHVLSSPISPSLIRITLSAEMWFQKTGKETFGSDWRERPELKSASAHGGNNNTAGTHRCFHKGYQRIVFTLLK